MTQHPNPIEAAILELGEQFYAEMKGEIPGVFNKDFWQGKIMEWAMKDPSFKVDMFRFVDVLPVLHTTDQISQHVREYLLKKDRPLPTVMSTALKAAAGGLTAGIATKTMKKNVTDMAERFIVGHNAKEAMPVLKKLHKNGIAFTVDLLGEATVSEEEAVVYKDRYLDLIDNLAAEASQWKDDPVIDTNHLGAIPRTNVSLKLSAMDSQLDPADMAGSVARLKERVTPLFLRAKEKNVFINVDMEDWHVHDITYNLFEEVLSHPELKDWPHVGIVVQAYLKESEKDVQRLLSLAKNRGAPITIRLVKGAYWDQEVVHANLHGYPIPVFTDKARTDVNYERLSRLMLQNIDHLSPAFGSHNIRSVAHALAWAKEEKAPERSYEIQMLYGMAEPERKTFRKQGHRVRVYAPVGELLPGMAYLVRRLLENTSNDGFLKLSYHDNVDTDALLQSPQPQKEEQPLLEKPESLDAPFFNCPYADFTQTERRNLFQQALDQTRASFPHAVPVAIGGDVKMRDETLARECPSETSLKVADVSLANETDAKAAMENAVAVQDEWRKAPLRQKAELLEKLADAIQHDRDTLAAIMTYESAKTWREADADVAEAVDFCRYYARLALDELGPQKMGTLAGEDNRLFYEGRGPSVVIAPWNFPLAILCGMTTASLVAGNPTIMKPAEQSSAIAYALYQRMIQVGFDPKVVQFLPGRGEVVGAYLVNHPQMAQIAFTGSKAVGLQILQDAAVRQDGQPQVKRVICEMGGKNAIIVDDDADLDEAVLGVAKSAFGFAGQKCSACSRVFVVGTAYESFKHRLAEATASLKMGPAHLPESKLGPVVDEEAFTRLQHVTTSEHSHATLVHRGADVAGGHYIPPTIFEVNDAKHPLMQNEFFGPVVALMKANSFDEAITHANSTEYALTGAVYSRSPDNLDKARRNFRVGNLYLNQGSTGAIVARQAFGGFGMSGTGTKAGGPGYLRLFADARSITENTMRRGFTPDLEN
ncbi:MAG: 1-pyrroline-5-carboxylate dehydrogenase [Myxococcales bacterium]|mgnify:CR=1 FL=1|nr:1-pyrroline-5-carboxylate dehydrogenase [Myxococcales bacterium]